MADVVCEYEAKDSDESLTVFLSDEVYRALCVLASAQKRCTACFARSLIEEKIPALLVAELETLRSKFPVT